MLTFDNASDEELWNGVEFIFAPPLFCKYCRGMANVNKLPREEPFFLTRQKSVVFRIFRLLRDCGPEAATLWNVREAVQSCDNFIQFVDKNEGKGARTLFCDLMYLSREGRADMLAGIRHRMDHCDLCALPYI